MNVLFPHEENNLQQEWLTGHCRYDIIIYVGCFQRAKEGIWKNIFS